MFIPIGTLVWLVFVICYPETAAILVGLAFKIVFFPLWFPFWCLAKMFDRTPKDEAIYDANGIMSQAEYQRRFGPF